ncbi:MAG: hypothetical protein A2X32_08840 [Elusimicrobia bacterium GWC2_64_44]|nr:MAG: hypothetical protein A2X32_08840 [Elusimicrobia bacterium GWC2_64_44]
MTGITAGGRRLGRLAGVTGIAAGERRLGRLTGMAGLARLKTGFNLKVFLLLCDLVNAVADIRQLLDGTVACREDHAGG